MVAATGVAAVAQEPPADAAAAAPYADRLLEGGTLAPDLADVAPHLALRDASGWPRSVSIETRRQAQRISDATRLDAAYAVLHAALDTPNHGALTLDVSKRLFARSHLGDFAADTGEDSPPSTAFTLAQRLMPLADGWQASHFLGNVDTLNTGLARQSSRYSLPTRLVRGVAGQWENRAQGLVLLAAGGAPGVLDTLGQGGLSTDGSRVRMAGLQWTGTALAYAAQVAEAARGPVADLGGFSQEGRSLWQSLRWQGLGAAAQAHLLASRSDQGTSAQGGWLDAEFGNGPVAHRAGVHRLPAGLHWLGTPLGSDTQGAYYRWRWHTRRDLLEAQLDTQWPLAGGGATRQLWTSGRHQLDLRDAVGAQFVDFESGGSRNWQAFLFNDRVRDSGAWRLFAGTGRDAGGGRSEQAGVEWSGDWSDARFSLSAALQGQAGQPGTLVDLAAAVNGPVTSRLSLDVGARSVTTRDGLRVSQSLNTGAQWMLAPGWSLGAALSASRGQAFVPSAGPSGAPPPLEDGPPAISARYAWVSLRYDFAAGSPEVPLGGPASGGGGRLEGVLFLDANANGRIDGGEQRAAGIVVVLDGRFAVRTDAQGRFEFAFVATGEHQLSVMNDNLPLPWHVPADAADRSSGAARISVRISARQTTRIEIGAVQSSD